MTEPSLQDQVAVRILDLWETHSRDVVTPLIEEICDKWQGNSSLVSNLIRCANDRGISVTIDPEMGGVVISEPENDLSNNEPMLGILFANFGYIQRDASSHMVTYLHDIDADIAEAA